jgi:hypothetical protein
MDWRNPFSRWSNYGRTFQTGGGIFTLNAAVERAKLLLSWKGELIFKLGRSRCAYRWVPGE